MPFRGRKSGRNLALVFPAPCAMLLQPEEVKMNAICKFLVTILLPACLVMTAHAQPDTILINGKILTVDADFSIV